MMRARLAQGLTLVGYLGLWILLPLWYLWLAPSTELPAYFVVFLVAPLVFPFSGLVRGRVYTYKWSLFVSLLYFMHGVGEAWTWPDERGYALLEVLLSLVWFAGAIGYVRSRRAIPKPGPA